MDSGPGNPCDGLTLCTTAGTSCEGDELVTCAANADGCMVETTVDCGDDGEICDDSSGTPACIDQCDLIPAAERCDVLGARECTDAGTLEVCAANADGCLVLEITECDMMPGGLCDASGTMPMCVLPADPCAGLADACTTAGTSCTGDDLVTCAPNAFGCLVATTTDCSSRASGTCDASGAVAACAFTGDPCAGVTECTAPTEATCDGPELVTCAADAFGCMVETRTDCTSETFGFCDETATGADACSTAATDPCMGLTECGTEPGRACADADTLTECAANAFGCFVTETTECGASTPAEVCDASGEMPVCVDPCTLVRTCPSALFCNGQDIIECMPDANGCLVETDRTTCALGPCTDTATPVCTDSCEPALDTPVLDCDMALVMGDTAVGATTAIGAYECGPSSYGRGEHIYRFVNDAVARVRIVATRLTGSGDQDLFALDARNGAACTDTTECLDSSTGATATETVEFDVAAGQPVYIAYDLYGSATTAAPATYSLAITCIESTCGDSVVEGPEGCDDGNTVDGDRCSSTCAVETGSVCYGSPSTCGAENTCGNGFRETGETCDDGNTASSDGCSATCAIESGYSCTTGTPNTCAMPPAHSMCSGATSITTTTTVSGDTALGGAPIVGAGCTGGATGTGGGLGFWYQLTIPAYNTVEVEVDPSFDAIVELVESCASTSCLARDDSDPEFMAIENTTGAPLTRFVFINARVAGVTGTYDATFTFLAPTCGNGDVELGEACDDGGTAAGNGCSATCTVESGYVCTGEPSTCVASATNGTCATARAITFPQTITGENLAGGGPRPTGTSCGSTVDGNNALFYSISIPAGATAVIQVTELSPTFDAVVLSKATCAATSCSSRVDSSTTSETMTIANTGTTALDRVIAVHNFDADALGSYDIAFSLRQCGNNVVETGETCDDGNTTAGDGCTATCTVQSGWACTGSPSVCTNLCGNGVLDSGEGCDDMNAATGDGCSPTCAVESGFLCTGAPSMCRIPYSHTAITAMCADMSGATAITFGSQDDSVSTRAALPFSLPFFGATATHYAVSTNGNVQLFSSSSAGSTSSAAGNTTIPNTSGPNGTVAPFWDDLVINTGGAVRWTVLGTAPNRTFVVEWDDVRTYLLAGSDDVLTFQAHVTEAGVVEFHYCSMVGTTRPTGASATIGVESFAGTSAHQVSFDTAGAATTGNGYRLTPN